MANTHYFNEEANISYKYTSAEDLEENIEDLGEMVEHHQNRQAPRLKLLREYYKGNNKVLWSNRRREEHLADNRATHNFAKYVSQFIQGYMVGVPLKTTHKDEGVNEQLDDINQENSADEHNSDLVLDQSIYGRSYELVYRNEGDDTKFTTLSPLETFVIHDTTVEENPIAAVRYVTWGFSNRKVVYFYTDKKIYTYNKTSVGELEFVDESDHYFQGVPIIEYENNKYRQGDFEDVLSLIDLYDSAQSDTANYMQDLNDAMLKITGNLDIDTDEAKAMKESNILMLQTEPDAEGKVGQADADYIYKQYDVQGTESYKDRIFNNILLFTSIPNLLDDNESQSSPMSGEALKMKLFSLSQKRAIKERLFKRSLRRRYELISNIMSIASEGDFDVNKLDISFTENLPSMIEKEIEWFSKMGGQLSQRTMLGQLSFVDNPDDEIEEIEEEGEELDSYPFAMKDGGDGQQGNEGVNDGEQGFV